MRYELYVFNMVFLLLAYNVFIDELNEEILPIIINDDFALVTAVYINLL